MSTEHSGEDALEQWYRERIGKPNTGDEVQGYVLFAIGVVLGVVGIFLFIPSGSGSVLRQWAIVISAAGLVGVFAGPLVRLPLRRAATTLIGLGAIVCLAALLWFVLTYPAGWNPQSGQPAIIATYAVGILVMAFGGIFVPTTTTQPERRAAALADEVDRLRETLADTQADEADLADIVSDLREEIADMEADESDLAQMVAGLRGELDDTQADEADLAAQLEALRATKARFELYEDAGGKYRWRLRHRNGNIIADSSQGYTRRHNAQKGLHSVKENALGATVLQLETEADIPDEGEEFEPPEETESKATFEYYEDNAGEHRWRLRHDNGNIIADSGEGYSRRSRVEDAIERVRNYVGPAEYLRFDPTGFEVYEDSAGEWRWRLVHRNGNILAAASEGYTRRRDARRSIDRIQESLDEMEFEVYEDEAGDHRWRLRSANNQIVATGGEGYSSRSEAENAVERVEEYAPDADRLEVTEAVFEIFEDSAGEYRWRLRHRNGNILADGGEGYSDRTAAREGIESVKQNAPNADTEATED